MHMTDDRRLRTESERGAYMNELRNLIRRKRTERGLSQEQLGAMVNVSASSIGSYENGRLIPVPETAAILDRVFETGDRIQWLCNEARGQSLAGHLRPWAENERQATVLRTFELAVVPGLLQTEAYARHLLTAVGLVANIEVELGARMTRQEVVTRAETPARFIAVIDESVLHRQVGSRKVMAEQIRALIEACDRPNVSVHVVPASANAYVGLTGPFALTTVHARVLGYLDSYLGGRIVDDPEDIQVLEAAWEGVRSYALPVEDSREVLNKALELWT